MAVGPNYATGLGRGLTKLASFGLLIVLSIHTSQERNCEWMLRPTVAVLFVQLFCGKALVDTIHKCGKLVFLQPPLRLTFFKDDRVVRVTDVGICRRATHKGEQSLGLVESFCVCYRKSKIVHVSRIHIAQSMRRSNTCSSKIQPGRNWYFLFS